MKMTMETMKELERKHYAVRLMKNDDGDRKAVEIMQDGDRWKFGEGGRYITCSEGAAKELYGMLVDAFKAEGYRITKSFGGVLK